MKRAAPSSKRAGVSRGIRISMSHSTARPTPMDGRWPEITNLHTLLTSNLGILRQGRDAAEEDPHILVVR